MYVLPGAVAYSFSDGNGLCYVWPAVLSMRSCFPMMGLVACDVGNICVSAAVEQIVINFQRIRHVALFDLLVICRKLPLVGGLQHVV